MTKNRDLKRRIRARMAKTGESYTAARRHLVSRPAAAGRGRSERPTLADAVRADDVEGALIALLGEDAWTAWAALDQLVARVRERSGGDAESRLGAVLEVVYDELGFAAPDGYDDPALNHLDHVLERRRGTPAALAGLLVVVGERLGLALRPVAFPGHFLVRAERPGPVFLDPASGHVIGRDALLDIAVEELGVTREAAAAHLAPTDARGLVVRLLQNLGKAHRARGDEGRALVAADRLVDVAADPADRLDRGLSLWALGAFEAASEDVRAYLEAHPDAPDAALARQAQASLRALSLDAN